MENYGIHIFVSGRLTAEAEKIPARKSPRGRPLLHSTCLILAMLAVKSMLDLGYRQTVESFSEAGYRKLPNFRTVQWRAARLKNSGMRMCVETASNGAERRLLLMPTQSGPFITSKDSQVNRLAKQIKRMNLNFTELLL